MKARVTVTLPGLPEDEGSRDEELERRFRRLLVALDGNWTQAESLEAVRDEYGVVTRLVLDVEHDVPQLLVHSFARASARQLAAMMVTGVVSFFGWIFFVHDVLAVRGAFATGVLLSVGLLGAAALVWLLDGLFVRRPRRVRIAHSVSTWAERVQSAASSTPGFVAP